MIETQHAQQNFVFSCTKNKTLLESHATITIRLNQFPCEGLNNYFCITARYQLLFNMLSAKYLMIGTSAAEKTSLFTVS